MDAVTCRNVIEACFPAFSVHCISFLAEGWDSAVWEVNEDYVFRFPKRPEIAPGLLKEIRLLPVLAPNLPLRVPQFECVWLGGPPYAGVFVGYRKIPGQQLSPEHIHSSGSELAQQLGPFLTSLHRFPLAQAAALGMPGGGAQEWREQRQAFYSQVRERIYPLLSTTEQHSISVGWGRFLDDDENFRFSPALIHSDLNCEHILLHGRSHRLTGVIDWEDAAIGDPALDFAGLLDCGQPFVRSVLAAYDGHGDEGILARAGFYRAIGPCYQVLYGQDIGAQEHVIQGLNGLRTVWARKKR